MPTIIKLIALGCGLLSLSGCAHLNSRLDCPMKPGVMCESLDEVNQQVDQGRLGQSDVTNSCRNCHTREQVQKDQFLQMWVAPYKTASGDEIGPTWVHSKLAAHEH